MTKVISTCLALTLAAAPALASGTGSGSGTGSTSNILSSGHTTGVKSKTVTKAPSRTDSLKIGDIKGE